MDHEMEEDLHTAAYYYQIACEKHQSARANFNLGFMHQWGLGLKQDFPMAKRHYDLALTHNYDEAEIAVQIALMAISVHEFAIRCQVLIEEWWYQRDSSSSTTETKSTPRSPKEPSVPSSNPAPRDPAHSDSPGMNKKKTQEEVIMSHIFNRSSLIIVILFLILVILQITMSFVGRPQRR
mmetsp:Transcript_25976/g.55619  ORF Transcript_25976/g.55619 Transcript_25976/m.55619 type:complete len:180 (-) Transcript_25976:2129-2668(-)